MHRSVLAAACVGLGLSAASPASAQCSFQVLPIPVSIVGTRPAITVKVGGREAHFLIDSGSAVNLVSYELLASRNLTAKARVLGPSDMIQFRLVVGGPRRHPAGRRLQGSWEPNGPCNSSSCSSRRTWSTTLKSP